MQGSAGRGTFINGERIQSRTELKFGDYLSLGGHVPTTSQSDADHAKKVNSDYAKLWVENRNNAADGCTVFLFQVDNKNYNVLTTVNNEVILVYRQ